MDHDSSDFEIPTEMAGANLVGVTLVGVAQLQGSVDPKGGSFANHIGKLLGSPMKKYWGILKETSSLDLSSP